MDQDNELNLGEYLRRSREEANFSIEKLSLKTRINANVLRSLESEDFKSLPNPAYLKGFIQSYVKMFNLDEPLAMAKLEESYLRKTGQRFPSLGQSRVQSSSFKEKDQDTEQLLHKTENIIDATKSFMPFIIGAVVIAASFGGYKVVSNMINQEVESRKEIESSQDDDFLEETPSTEENGPESTAVDSESQEEAPLAPEVVVSPKETPQAPKETPKETAPTVVTEKKVEPKKKASQQRVFPAVEFKSIPTKLYTLKPDAPENKNDSLMPPSYKAKLNPELQNLYINALEGETWVSYKVDDEPIQNEFIREGKALFLQGKTIRMFFGNINVTRIFLNNTFIDANSPTGVKTIVFPQSEAVNFQRPLFPRSSKGELFTSEEYLEKMKEEEQKLGSP